MKNGLLLLLIGLGCLISGYTQAQLWQSAEDDGLLAIRKILRNPFAGETYILASTTTTAGVSYTPLLNFEDEAGTPIGFDVAFMGNGGQDFLLIKLDSDYLVDWVVAVGSSLDDTALDLTIGNSGRVGISGYFTSNSDPAQQVTVTESSGSETYLDLVPVGSPSNGVHRDAFALFFNWNGTYLDHMVFGGEGDDIATNIHYSGNGWGILGNYEPDNVDFNGETWMSSGSSGDSNYFLLALTGNRNFDWVSTWGNGGDNYEAARPWRSTCGLDYASGSWLASFYWSGNSCRFFEDGGNERSDLEFDASSDGTYLGVCSIHNSGTIDWTLPVYTGSGLGVAGNSLRGLHLTGDADIFYFSGTSDEFRYGDEMAEAQSASSMDDPFVIAASTLDGSMISVDWLDTGSAAGVNQGEITEMSLSGEGDLQISGYYSDRFDHNGVGKDSSQGVDCFFLQLPTGTNPEMFWSSEFPGNEIPLSSAPSDTLADDFLIGGVMTSASVLDASEGDAGVGPFLMKQTFDLCDPGPAVDTPVLDQNNVCAGTEVNLEVSSWNGDLQWQLAIIPGVWSNIAGENASILSYNVTEDVDFRVVATLDGCSQVVNSTVVSVSVLGDTVATACPLGAMTRGADPCTGQYSLEDFTGLLTPGPCVTALVESSPAIGTALVPGLHTITIFYNDAFYGSGSCSFDVDVIETDIATISMNDKADEVGTGCVLTLSDISSSATITDPCGRSWTLEHDPADPFQPGDDLPIGSYTLHILATADDGTTLTAEFILLVQDTTSPAISYFGGGINLVMDDACEVTLPDVTALGSLSITDACAVTITQTPSAGTVLPGVLVPSITVTADDGLNPPTSQAIPVALEDTSGPSFTPLPGDELLLTAPIGNCIVNKPNITTLLSPTDCTPPVSFAVTYTDIGTGLAVDDLETTLAIGEYDVSVAFSDLKTNTSSYDFKLTVEEDTPPLVWLNMATIDIECTWTVGDFLLDGVVGSSDACGTVSLISQYPAIGSVNPGPLYPAPPYWVNIADEQGNITYFEFTPTLSTSANIPVLSGLPATYDLGTSAGCEAIVPGFEGDYSVGGCGDLTDWVHVQIPPMGSLVPDGTVASVYMQNTATLAVTNTLTTTLNVLDVTAPVIACPGAPIDVILDEDCYWNPQDIDFLSMVSDNCSLISDADLSFTIDPMALQSSTMTSFEFKAEDEATNTTSCIIDVNPIDVSDPKLVCPGDQVFIAPAGATDFLFPDLEPLASYADCSPVTFSQSIPENTAYSDIVNAGSVTLTVTDSGGLFDVCTVAWTLIDDVAPTIPAMSDVNLAVTVGCAAVLPDFTAGVIPDPDFSEPVVLSQDPAAGTLISAPTAVTVYAEDAAGNETTELFIVTPFDNTAPVLSCPGSAVPVVLDGDCLWNPQDLDFLSMVSDNCTADADLMFSFSLDENALQGATTVSFSMTVEDEAGLSASCTITVDPQDVNDPVLTCPGPLSYLAPADGSDFLFPDLEPLVTINDCSPTTYTQDLVIGTAFTNETSGTYLITITDDAGNSSTCGSTWELIDDVDPVMTALPDVDIPVESTSCDFLLPDYTGAVVLGPDFSEPLTVTQSPLPGFYTASTEVTLTAEDGAGNTSSISFWAHPVDTTPPVINCPVTALELDMNEDCFWDPQDIDFLSMISDNCTNAGDLTQTFSIDIFSLQPESVTSIIWTVTDEAGEASICVIFIDPQDVSDPVLTCPGPLTYFAPADGSDFVFPDLEALVTVDDCSPTSYAQIPLAGSTYTDEESGIYVITITDAEGLISTCSSSWTLIDDVDPVIAPMPDVDIPVEATSCEFLLPDYTTSAVTSPDFSEPVTVTQLPAPGLYSMSTEVTLTATDGAGNTSQITFWAHPIDTTPPDMMCPVDPIPVTLDADCMWNPADLDFLSMVEDNCTSDADLVFNFTIDETALQNQSVTSFAMLVTDLAGETNLCTITVDPQDVDEPELTCPGTLVFYAPADGSDFLFPDLEPLITVDDCSSYTYDQNVAIGTPFTDESSGTYVITVTDAAGNESVCVDTWWLFDDVDPVIDPMPDVDISTDGNCQYLLPDFTSSVVVQPDFSEPVSIIQDPVPGTYTTSEEVTITVVDGAGNFSQITFWANPVDDTPPELTCPAGAIDVNLDEDCMWNPADLDFLSMVDDNCTAVSDLELDFDIDITSLQPESLTSFTMTVTDLEGLESSCTITVNPLDVSDPVLTCPGPIEFYAPADGSDFVFPSLEPLVTVDDCSSTTYEQIPAIGTTYTDEANGIYLITITDAVGNASICTSSWILIDDVIPSMGSLPADTLYVDANCEAFLPNYIPQVVVGPDFSMPVSLDQVPAAGSLLTEPTTVTITAQDAAGNESEIDFLVIPVDAIQPTIDCATPIELFLDADCNWDPSQINFVERVDDNCTAAIDLDLTFSIDTTAVYHESINTFDLTATDTAGNSFTCAVNVVTYDVIFPVIAGPDTLEFIAPNDGSDFLFPNLSPLYAVNECGGHSFDQSIAIGTAYADIVTNETINVSAMDAAGNLTVFPVVWSLIDDVAPVIEQLSNVTVPTTGDCEAILDDYLAGLAVTEWFSAPAALVQVPAAGTAFFGGQVVTITATDLAGNSTEMTFEVTATDQENPTVDCTTVLDVVIDENCEWHVDDLDILGLLDDNCTTPEDLALTFNINASLPQPIAQDWFNLAALDAAGNSSNCDVILNVIDDVAPVLSCSDTLVYIAPNDPVLNTFSFPDLAGEYAVVECNPHPSNALNQGIASGTAYTSPVYEESFTITATDNGGNVSTCPVVWSLLDVDPPVEVFLPDTALDVSGGCIIEMPNFLDDFVAEDYFSGIASVEQFPPAGQLVSATGMVDIVITDNAGNERIVSFEAFIADEVAPEITCPSETENIVLTGVLCYHELGDARDGILIDDNCDNNPSIVQTWPVDTALYPSPDPHIVTFLGLDANGNESTCTKSYMVTNNASPILECGNELELFTSQVGCEFDLLPLNLEADLIIQNDCGFDYNVQVLYSNTTVTLEENVNISYLVTRVDNGAFDFCPRAIQLTDDEAPIVLETPAPLELEAENDCMFDIPDYTYLAYTDCSEVTVTQDPPQGLISGPLPEDFAIHVTFTDSNDLTTVVEIPIGLSPDLDSVEFPDVIQPVGDNCEAFMPDMLNGNVDLYDECGIFIGSVIQIPTEGSAQTPGSIITASIVLQDDPGMTPLYTFEVNFKDEETPVFDCAPEIQSQNFQLDADVCSMIVPLEIPVASDNCTLVFDGFESGDDPDVERSHGVYSALYRAEDPSGNVAECEVTYTIEDVTPPAITCTNPEPSCESVIDFDLPEFSDACGIEGELIQTTNLAYGPGSEFPAGITEITYKIYDIHGNVDSCTTSVENTQVAIDFVMPFTGLCELDGAVQIESTQEGAVWSGDLDADGIIDPEVLGIGDYEITVTIDDEGCIAQETYAFSVDASPTATFVLTEEVLCLAADPIALEYTASSASGTWSWSENVGEEGILDPAALGPGTHDIVLQGVNGACETYYTHTIEIVEDLGVNWTALPEGMCITAGPLQMAVDAPDYVTYSFNALIDSDGFFDPQAAGVGSHTIELTAAGASCGEVLTQTVTVGQEALADAGEDQTLCGDQTLLEASSDNPDALYQWSSDIDVAFSNAASTETSVETTVYGPIELQFTVSTPEGCVTSDQVIVDFHEPPTEVDAGPDQLLVGGETEAMLDGQYDGPGGIWWSSTTEGVVVENVLNLNTNVAGLQIGENWIVLTVTNGVCEPVSDSLMITVEEELIVPTGFSPNNDGENDFFVIDGSYDSIGLKVFSRWGNLVFESNNYQNRWDGRDLKGRPLPEDTYFYSLELDGLPYDGFIIIKRQ